MCKLLLRSISNSPYYLLCNSYDVSLENLIMDQIMIQKLKFFQFPLLACLILCSKEKL